MSRRFPSSSDVSAGNVLLPLFYECRSPASRDSSAKWLKISFEKIRQYARQGIDAGWPEPGGTELTSFFLDW
jgi:hypothetical protein